MKTVDLSPLRDPNPKVKYAFVKQLLEWAASSPEKLYPQISEFEVLMKDENNILRWTALDVLGHLSAVDDSDHLNTILPRIIELFREGNLITSSHAIFAMGHIAKNSTSHRDNIVEELLKVNSIAFKSDDCRSIAVSKVLDALMPIVDQIADKPSLRVFVDKALMDHRNATRRRAEKARKALDKTDTIVV